MSFLVIICCFYRQGATAGFSPTDLVTVLFPQPHTKRYPVIWKAKSSKVLFTLNYFELMGD